MLVLDRDQLCNESATMHYPAADTASSVSPAIRPGPSFPAGPEQEGPSWFALYNLDVVGPQFERILASRLAHIACRLEWFLPVILTLLL